ncbi:hypothetical protein B1748_31750 [Paenibacillus sp. MY03]|uniref:alpha-L-rhamnosidase-related protein n=1 Tax=Paenibacillus sp. MY03 TaxID=302980 RepID=UPI000B3CF902|nr:family 78 glycoside hydrolase catalytic domain [Paenibacillus sp. MY03]OUS69193.1 hypothetical protein B1748_31750 [Paenibacillus sp. MY03]
MNQFNIKPPPWQQTPDWPCRWISCHEAGPAPFVVMYRCTFNLKESRRVRINVSGDERYELYFDRDRIGRGSERGDRINWFYETYEVEIPAGEHQWLARCWSLGELKPWAQVSVQPGFLLSPEDEALAPLMGTGEAHWETKPLPGYRFVQTPSGIGTGAKLDIDGASFDWDAMSGEGGGWLPAQAGEPVYLKSNQLHLSSVLRYMRPASLPAMQETSFRPASVRFVGQAGIKESDGRPVEAAHDLPEEHSSWSGLFAGGSMEISAHTRKRVVIDLGNYYCFYPELTVSGGRGSVIRLHWEESFYDEAQGHRKTNREDIVGKWFRGIGDTFRPDGGVGRRFDTLWWHAGRYAELIVETEDEALRLHELRLTETRYPLSMEGFLSCQDERLDQVVAASFRTLQMCAHETYMDCPYWEQLMYVGDTRIQSLITYVSTLDDRLPRKALDMFRASRSNHLGLVNCAYPDQGGKHISSFSLWWAAMVYDYALWRGDREWVRLMMASVRDELERLMCNRSANGAVKLPVSWNFLDWPMYPSGAWSHGEPPHGPDRLNAAYNLLIIYTLELVSKIEDYLGETELAARALRLAEQLSDTVERLFWNEERLMFADDTEHLHFSEHAQVLATLCGSLAPELKRRLMSSFLQAGDLMRTSIYFDHYTFEALAAGGKTDVLLARLEPWLGMGERGLRTTPEIFLDHSRSDCHAWGAHPIYHLYANLLGIRPASMGFAAVEIRPQPGALSYLHGKLPHRNGFIEVKVVASGMKWLVEASLPPGLSGTLVWGDETYPLQEGQHVFQF